MFTARNKIFLTAAIFVVLFFVLTIVLIFPLLSELKSISLAIAFDQATIETLEAKVVNLSDIQKKQALIQDYLAKIKSNFVDVSSPVDFMNFLESEAQGAGLRIQTTASAPTGAVPDQRFNAEFQVVAGGASSNCLRFLELIEQSQWFLEVDSFNVQRVNEKTTSIKGFENLQIGDVYCFYFLKTFSPSILSPKTVKQQSEVNTNEAQNIY